MYRCFECDALNKTSVCNECGCCCEGVITQGDIVKETGIAQSHVSVIINEINTNTNLLRKNVYKVCRAMGIKRVTVEIN